ncbi:hypothetical protein ES754_09985 [Psychrobacter frigidicola]|uniref:Uncharacterized protein n=1 Tax=Psychrobacter frigidicola TaxID=45611 RepID=A0A5C6ZZC3_9GAMM|nr:DciA family protein [Psychrobacter frigidicola]TXD96461.1 hypothetical protein ES754_09985 [Psychrobacter frigidicola]
MSKKQPNRLAQLIDHQAFAGSALPRSLADNMQLYTQATNEIKKLLVECLPDEILDTCWVVGLSTEQLTLSVSSMTAANHIRYLQNAYLKVLTEQSITFQQLKQIRVVVVKNSASNPLTRQLPTLLSTHKANENQPLSQRTKRTISQAAKHVTTDKNLKEALLRLLKD